MVKMICDNTGRFAERPFYGARDLDNECERLIRNLLLKRRGTVDYPVATDDLTVLIEMHDADLDPYADLSVYGADVEGVTEFFPSRGPKVSISNRIAADERRENRFRTTPTHEFGHVKFHGPLWAEVRQRRPARARRERQQGDLQARQYPRRPAVRLDGMAGRLYQRRTADASHAGPSPRFRLLQPARAAWRYPSSTEHAAQPTQMVMERFGEAPGWEPPPLDDVGAYRRYLDGLGFVSFAYPRSDFIHIDLGPKREWGERFAPRPAFARETPPARQRLAESRTIKGGGVAGVATVGAAGVEVAQEALAEAQDAVLPLVPYLDTLRWVFIAAALAGIAVAIYARWDDWKRGAR